ncbi:sugar ABC transporter permease [Paenibacillus sp. FSL H8-0548]|uniref:carbohydrate ABC transporter permease n=1 Tax=Paenibacillus sp. FSL H8-0548 TaxID=1920422 RepID=UPI00096F4645|nr:sugar ABC transporter permease [Paenibacillus sp. FSL H8-0548]OMF28644.1 sugar ABC transporter permease [Paenibacillus sp. FSL H8-0548]
MKTWKETATGYIFIGPMMLGVVVLTIIPLIATILLSLVDWNFVSGLNQMKFVGLNNFSRLFNDDTFFTAFKNNILLLIVVPVTMLFSLLIAIVLNKKVFFKDGFKVIYFMPYISSIVAVAAVWRVLMHPTYGPINEFLKSIGMDNPPKWLADSDFALLSVMIIMVWVQIGYNLIIYIAALQNIPKDLYEAADIDGASAWAQFRNVTVPTLSPTSFFLLVTGVISSFKAFDLIAVLTQGGPADSTSVIVYYLYETAFINLRSGYSSAMAVILLAFVLLLTVLQWLGQKKWVNY